MTAVSVARGEAEAGSFQLAAAGSFQEPADSSLAPAGSLSAGSFLELPAGNCWATAGSRLASAGSFLGRPVAGRPPALPAAGSFPVAAGSSPGEGRWVGVRSWEAHLSTNTDGALMYDSAKMVQRQRISRHAFPASQGVHACCSRAMSLLLMRSCLLNTSWTRYGCDEESGHQGNCQDQAHAVSCMIPERALRCY